ncbi:hypothetical protein KJ682_01455 [bacterium]|nr:hypothetical protein [bacterium]
MSSLPAFSVTEYQSAKRILATQVALMMGRKLEEGDWTHVYCNSKGIPDTGWSNLHIDIAHEGLGVELKMLRCAQLKGRPLKSVCGTTLMHPAATRSIRIDDPEREANKVKDDVLYQYAELINERSLRVARTGSSGRADMRTGWLIWEDTLTEFLYFEEPMIAPDPTDFYAEWNITPARGIRKSSKSLWVYEVGTNRKRYSVTTTAGIKIQPYFDVPPPSDPNLYYFRVQSEALDADTIRLWILPSTARALESRLGILNKESLSGAILTNAAALAAAIPADAPDDGLAVPVLISMRAYEVLVGLWEAVSDEHRAQTLARALASLPK